MLDFIRDKAQSLVVKLIFGIIIVVFVFWGVGNMNSAPSGALAVVNGESITLQEFVKLYQRVVEEQRKSTPDITSDPVKFSAFKRQILQQLVALHLRRQEAARIGLTITPHELKLVLAGISVFQDTSGKFDPEAYRRVVASQGISQGEFEAEYSKQLLDEKLIRGIAASVDVSETEARALYNFSLEKRKAEYLLFSAADYAKDAAASDEDVNHYYTNNKASFTKPAMANLEYLILTPQTLAAGYPVTDQEAQEYYEKNSLRFFQPESFEARHIFIECPPEGSKTPGAEEKIRQAGAAIDDIVKQLAAGGDFAAIAAARSEDKQSAVQGGAIGWLNKGQVGSEAFENAALALKPGETSGPVRTEYGFHIIRLEAKKAAHTPPLAEVKKDIVAALGQEKADADFAHVEKAAEDGLAMGTSFADLAKKFHLSVNVTGLIARTEAEEKIEPAKDSRQLLGDAIAGLESASAVQDGKAAPAVTIPVPVNIQDGVALIRVLEAKPAMIPPLEELRGTIVSQVKLDKGMVLARAAAEKALPEFGGKTAPKGYADKLEESGPAIRLFPELRPLGLMQDLVSELFLSSGDWLPRVFDCPKGAIIARTKAVEPVTDEEWGNLKEIFISQLRQDRTNKALLAFMQRLYMSAKIEESPDALDKLSFRGQ